MTDFRYLTAAEPIAGIMDVRMLAGRDQPLSAEHRMSVAPGAEPHRFRGRPLSSVARHSKLRPRSGRRELVATGDVVETLRLVKDADELDAIRAVGGADRAGVRGARRRGPERAARDWTWPGACASCSTRAAPTGCRSTPSWPRTSAARHAARTPRGRRDLRRHPGHDRPRLHAGRLRVGLHPHVRRGRARCRCSREIYAVCLEAQLAAHGRGARRASARPGGGRGRPRDHRGGRPRRALRPRPRPRRGAGDPRGAAAGATASHATLEPGMVVTVEPGIYLPGEAACGSRIWSIVTDDRRRAAHRVP